MKRFHVFSMDMGAEVVEQEHERGEWVKVEEVRALETRIIDLSAKLDQAIDMLNCQKRMELLDLWAKEGMK